MSEDRATMSNGEGSESYSFVFITTEEVDKIFGDLESFQVRLVSDPSTAGVHYLQDITSSVRNKTNKVTHYLNQMTHRRLLILRSLNALKALYKQESDALLANNPLVKAQKSFKDREAYISVLLSHQVRAISTLEAQLHEVETLCESLRMTHRELRDVAGEVRSQAKIIEIELKTKAFYGDEFERNPVDTEASRKTRSDIDEFLTEEGF